MNSVIRLSFVHSVWVMWCSLLFSNVTQSSSSFRSCPKPKTSFELLKQSEQSLESMKQLKIQLSKLDKMVITAREKCWNSNGKEKLGTQQQQSFMNAEFWEHQKQQMRLIDQFLNKQDIIQAELTELNNHFNQAMTNNVIALIRANDATRLPLMVEKDLQRSEGLTESWATLVSGNSNNARTLIDLSSQISDLKKKVTVFSSNSQRRNMMKDELMKLQIKHEKCNKEFQQIQKGIESMKKHSILKADLLMSKEDDSSSSDNSSNNNSNSHSDDEGLIAIPEFNAREIWDSGDMLQIRTDRKLVCTEPFIPGIWIQLVNDNSRVLLMNHKLDGLLNILNLLWRAMVEKVNMEVFQQYNHNNKKNNDKNDENDNDQSGDSLKSFAEKNPYFLLGMRTAWIQQHQTDVAMSLLMCVHYLLLTEDEEIQGWNPFDDYRQPLSEISKGEYTIYQRFVSELKSKDELIGLLHRAGQMDTEVLSTHKVITMRQLGIAIVQYAQERKDIHKHHTMHHSNTTKQAMLCFTDVFTSVFGSIIESIRQEREN